MKTLSFTAAARKAFRKLPADAQARLRAALVRYAETGLGDVTKMKGETGARLRAGDYRAIFTETDTAVEVRAAGHRREIYR